MIGPCIFDRLSTDTNVTNLVGTSPARIFPQYVRQDQSYPQVVFDTRNLEETQTFGGTDSLTSVTVIVAAVSKTYDECSTLAQKVIDRIDQQGSTTGTTNVNCCFLEDVDEDVVNEPQSETILYYIKELTFTCWYGGNQVISSQIVPPTPGTVTSVGLSMPNIFSVSGSPVTTSGTLAASLVSQTAGVVLASPATVPGVPTFRPLVLGDLPALPVPPLSDVLNSGNDANSSTIVNLTQLSGNEETHTLSLRAFGLSSVGFDIKQFWIDFLSSDVQGIGSLTATSLHGDGSALTGLTVSQVSGAVPTTRTISTSSPLTGGGDLSANRTISFASQTANQVLAAPNGSAGVPSFRLLVAADIPTLSLSKLSDGNLSGVLAAGNDGGAHSIVNVSAVGIGNSNPTSAKLVITGTPSTQGIDLSTSDQYLNARVIQNTNNSSDKDLYLGFASGATSNVHLYSNNTEVLKVSGGNLATVTGSLTATGHVSAGTTNTYGAITAIGGTSFTSVPPFGTASVGLIASTVGWNGSGFLFSNSTSGSKAFSMVYNIDTAFFGLLDASSATGLGTWSATGLRIGSATAATEKLDVVGLIKVTSSTDYNGGLYSGDSNWGFFIQRTAATDDYNVRMTYVSSAGTSRKCGIRELNAGWIAYANEQATPNFIVATKLGVGQTAPGDNIHVGNGSGNQFVRIDAGNTSQGFVNFYVGATSKWSIGKQTDNSYLIYDNVAARAVLQAASNGNLQLMPTAGNVGIGVSPSYKLDVSGDGHFTSNLTIDGNANIHAMGSNTLSAGWTVQAASSGFVGLIAQSAASATADIFEALDSGGNAGFRVLPDLSIVIGNRTSNPSSPTKGQMYFNSSTNKIMCYDGTAWRTVTMT